MAELLKVLGQAAPAAETETLIYTGPVDGSAVCSSIIICNRGAGDTKVRVLIAPQGAVTDPKHYIIYDETLSANESMSMTIGATVEAGDEIRVESDTGDASFSIFGTEVIA